MKKIIKKYWGLGLILIILSSLFVAATPVSAVNPLTWNTEAIPSAAGKVLLDSDGIWDIAIGPDGTTIYATTGDEYVYKSTNAGVTWNAIPNNAGMAPGTDTINSHDIAVAADDEDVVIVADEYNYYLRVSTNGGETWSDLDTATLLAATPDIYDIDVSSAVSGIRYAAIADGNGTVWTRKFGSSWAEWVDAGDYDGFFGDYFVPAVKFSPNFASDRTLTAVTDNDDAVYFEVLVFTSVPKWNEDAGLLDYPAEIYAYNGDDIDDMYYASIALAPDYPGAGEAESVAFIGMEASTDGYAGVYRMDDYISTSVTRNKQISSVAFDGSVAVAGDDDNAKVWRCENPLDSSPSFLANNTMKGPGGDDWTLVGFAGTNVVASTWGNEAAFAVSIDNGRSFSDISLINTAIDNISDFAVSPDGTKIYMVTNDGDDDVSLFRYDGGWARVLSYQDADDDYIVRVSPSNFDAVYVADTCTDSVKIFRSTAGGDTRWYSRSGPGITDLAVESDNVLYAAQVDSKMVSKSTNGGAYFGDGVDTKLNADYIDTIKCLSEDNIIVAGSGFVSYSTDGNESWTNVPTQFGFVPGVAGYSQVTATGLTEGSYIYASENWIGGVFMWTIGQSNTEPWTWVGPVNDLPANSVVTGMEMFGGTLYTSTANTTGAMGTFNRNTMPWLPELGFVFWSSPYSAGPPESGYVAAGFDNMPSALRLSSTSDYVKVWCAGGTALYSFMDTLVLTAPQAIAPEEGALIPLNVRTNYPYNITFTWTRPSRATEFTIMIALDPFFTQTILRLTEVAGSFTPTQSYTLTGDDLAMLTPGKTYYWTVMASKPLSSGMSNMPGRPFTVQAGEASVPVIDSPMSGASGVGEKPAFSWSPVTGTTKYLFQLSEGTAFAVPLVSEETMTTAIQINMALTAGKTYFWRVKALEPVESDWSAIGSFTVAVPAEEAPPPVTVTTVPAPQITITTPAPAPAVTLAPPVEETIAPAYIWAIIIIGAVLVIAVIVLIVRTRRSV
jgi:hypothetical protein